MKNTYLVPFLLLSIIFSCKKDNDVSTEGLLSAPAAPLELTAFDITETTFKVKWANGEETQSISSFKVYLDTDFFESTNDTVITITNLKPESDYEIFVTAINGDGVSSEDSRTIQVTTLPVADLDSPSVPQGLSASNTNAMSTQLSWSAATGNSEVIGYRVYQDDNEIAQITGTTYTVTGLGSATIYAFTVSAVDAKGNESDQSSALEVTTETTSVKAKVLVFTKTSGFNHNTKSESENMVQQIASSQGFDVVVDDDGSEFDSEANLNEYDIVVFTNTSGNTLNESQRDNVEAYAAQGGSFISNHAASDSYGHSTASSVSGNGKGIWDWYSENVTGCSVRNSPNHTRAGLGATVTVQNQNSGLTNGIVFPWSDNEEWYYWEDGYLDSSFTELLRVSDTGSNSYDDARMTAHYWERPDGGVSFYSSMGHAKSKYSDSDFVQLMSNAFAFILD